MQIAVYWSGMFSMCTICVLSRVVDEEVYDIARFYHRQRSGKVWLLFVSKAWLVSILSLCVLLFNQHECIQLLISYIYIPHNLNYVSDHSKLPQSYIVLWLTSNLADQFEPDRRTSWVLPQSSFLWRISSLFQGWSCIPTWFVPFYSFWRVLLWLVYVPPSLHLLPFYVSSSSPIDEIFFLALLAADLEPAFETRWAWGVTSAWCLI